MNNGLWRLSALGEVLLWWRGIMLSDIVEYSSFIGKAFSSNISSRWWLSVIRCRRIGTSFGFVNDSKSITLFSSLRKSSVHSVTIFTARGYSLLMIIIAKFSITRFLIVHVGISTPFPSPSPTRDATTESKLRRSPDPQRLTGYLMRYVIQFFRIHFFSAPTPPPPPLLFTRKIKMKRRNISLVT